MGASENSTMPSGQPSGAENEDHDLVRRSQSGDTRAFDELVTKYRTRIHAMTYQMVRNEQDAWDLAQDGFFKAWKSLSKFRFQSAFYTWLYRIVTNVAIDWLRKKQVRSEGEFDETIGNLSIEPTADVTPKGEVSPERQMERGELRERLDAAIAKLSPDHRQVILLKEIEGLQYHEIADVVGCSIGTVMSRLFYARKKLQSMLRDLHENV